MSHISRVYVIAYDGEPSMSGAPHRQQVSSEFASLSVAEHALKIVAARSKHAPKPNLRIETRTVSEWETVGGDAK